MRILLFSKKTCGPCQQLKMALKGTEISHVIAEIDCDEFPTAAPYYGIRGVPTLIFQGDEDEELARVVGADIKAIKETFERVKSA